MVALAVVALVFFASCVIDTPDVSGFEIERRKRNGEQAASALARRREYLGDLLSLQRVIISLLLVAISALCVAAWGWAVGIVVALFVALQYGVVARVSILHRFVQNQYVRFEPSIISFIEKYPIVTKVIRTITTPVHETKLGSREELLHLVSQSGIVLSHDEKLLVGHALTFGNKVVHEIMTPRSVIDSISRTELLNPLVLDQLHKTGHSRFPVIDGDIDHVVGVLHLRDILIIDSTKKHTSKVETAMEQKVFYIHENQTLDKALAAFLRTRHHLFIVVNEYRETVGIVSLEDVIEKLIGKKIVDEFDAHDDLRAVAEQNPRKNNHATRSEDV